MTGSVWVSRACVLVVLGSLAFWVLSPNRPTPRPGQVILSFSSFGNAEQRKIYEDLIALFERDHPEIDVRLDWVTAGAFVDKLKVRMAGRVAPDVTWVDVMTFYSFADKQVFRPLDEFMERDPDFDLGAYFPSIIEAFTFEGQHYALPKSCGSDILFYNRDHFEAAGLPLPDATWTWERLRESARRLTVDLDHDGRPNRFGVVGVDPMLLVLQRGGRFFDDTGTRCLLDSDEAEAACQFLVDLMYEDNVMPTVSQISALGFQYQSGRGGSAALSWSIYDLFPSGVVSLFPTDLVLSVRYARTPNLRWDVAPMPHFEGCPRLSILNGAAYAMTAQTRHPEEAWLLIAHLAGPVAQTMRAQIGDSTPAIEAIARSPVFLENPAVPIDRAVIVEQMATSHALPYHPRWIEIFREFTYAWDQMSAETGRPPVRQALREAARRIDRLLGEQ